MKLKDAVIEAMEDYLEGVPRPHDPAIMHTHDASPECGYYYGSALHSQLGNDIVVMVDDGFGSWTPESTDDIQVCAVGFAASLYAEGITE